MEDWIHTALEQGRYLAATAALLAVAGSVGAAVGFIAAKAYPQPRWAAVVRAADTLLLGALCALGIVLRYRAPEQLAGAPHASVLPLVVLLVLVACLELALAQGATGVWSRVLAAVRARRIGEALDLLHLTPPGVLLAGLATALGGALAASSLASAGNVLAVLTGVALAGVVLALLRGSARRWRLIAFAAVALSACAALGWLDLPVLLALVA